MATRSRQTWKLDAQGQYARQIGWKQNAQGKRVQHKFRLGTDLTEAKRREQRLRELWERIEGTSRAEIPLWDDLTLEIARQITKGFHQILLPPLEGESETSYTQRVDQTERRFPFLRLKARDLAKYAAGSGRETYSVADLMIWPASPREEFERYQTYSALPPLGVVEPSASPVATTNFSSTPSPQTLHQAMRDYKSWIEQHYFRPDLNRISSTAQNKLKQIQTLMERQEDLPLSKVGFEAIEQMICYWRRRPPKKGTTKAISRLSAESIIGELKRFFKWLHRSSAYAWRKPEDFDGIDTTVDTNASDTRRR